MFDAQMFVWWGKGGASSFPPPHRSNVSKIAQNCRTISIFALVGRKIFKLAQLPYFNEALFPAVTMDIRLHALYQKLRKRKTVEASNALVQSPGQNQ